MVWVGMNVSGLTTFDVFPFLLLNLGLTVISTFQSPLILLSQNRQNETDRERVQEILSRIDVLQKSVNQINDRIGGNGVGI